jgi:hypothetical protein
MFFSFQILGVCTSSNERRVCACAALSAKFRRAALRRSDYAVIRIALHLRLSPNPGTHPETRLRLSQSRGVYGLIGTRVRLSCSKATGHRGSFERKRSRTGSGRFHEGLKA